MAGRSCCPFWLILRGADMANRMPHFDSVLEKGTDSGACECPVGSAWRLHTPRTGYGDGGGQRSDSLGIRPSWRGGAGSRGWLSLDHVRESAARTRLLRVI